MPVILLEGGKLESTRQALDGRKHSFSVTAGRSIDRPYASGDRRMSVGVF